ncbi:MAG: hypothetical protein Tsb002_22150 [Wenzhouxiangellaceae bacterium]
MKRFSIILMGVVGLALAAVGGWWYGQRGDSAEREAAPMMMDQPQGGKDEPLYWVAPMDPAYRRDRPGKSPMGMDLVPVYADADVKGGVAIEAGLRAGLGIRTAAAEYGPLQPLVDALARVEIDESRLVHVHTRVSGWVRHLQISASGERVERGQLLFGLYSPELVSAQEEYLLARQQDDAWLVQAASERLAALGLDKAGFTTLQRDGEVLEEIPVTAHQAGYVMRLLAREGKFVSPDDDVLSIAALDQVWLIADVLQRQAPLIEVGQTAEVSVDALPGGSAQAVVDYIYPELDPQTLTARVRMRMENPGERLQPGMYARVRIQAPPLPPSVHVPRAALIRDGQQERLILLNADDRFVVREVSSGREVGDRVQILAGLDAGENIVVSGQFLLDSEAALGAETQRLQAADEDASGASHHHHHH